MKDFICYIWNDEFCSVSDDVVGLLEDDVLNFLMLYYFNI